MRASGADRGFTLVEALVALVILAAATVALLELASQGMRMAQAAGRRDEAVLIAASEAGAAGIDYALAPGDDTRQVRDFTLERRVSAVADQAHLLKIEIAVTWPARSGSGRYDLVTWRVDRALESPP
ncbi:MAG: type II secretion system protein [Alphaproteobacteria bacterium]|nr:type II secretion system protein [Alphaproteobacteria bacterium]